jgi:hypothetical protein
MVGEQGAEHAERGFAVYARRVCDALCVRHRFRGASLSRASSGRVRNLLSPEGLREGRKF